MVENKTKNSWTDRVFSSHWRRPILTIKFIISPGQLNKQQNNKNDTSRIHCLSYTHPHTQERQKRGRLSTGRALVNPLRDHFKHGCHTRNLWSQVRSVSVTHTAPPYLSPVREGGRSLIMRAYHLSTYRGGPGIHTQVRSRPHIQGRSWSNTKPRQSESNWIYSRSLRPTLTTREPDNRTASASEFKDSSARLNS